MWFRNFIRAVFSTFFFAVAMMRAADSEVTLSVNGAPAEPGDFKPADIKSLVLSNGPPLGAKAPDGQKFFVLSIAVQNVGQNGELFQTKEQLKCATSDSTQLQVDPATYQVDSGIASRSTGKTWEEMDFDDIADEASEGF